MVLASSTTTYARVMYAREAPVMAASDSSGKDSLFIPYYLNITIIFICSDFLTAFVCMLQNSVLLNCFVLLVQLF